MARALGLLLALVAAKPAWAQWNARLDSLLCTEEHAGFSGAVLVARGDTVVFERAYGRAARTGVDVDRLAFWIASDSKQFTATAVLKLEQSRKLRVADSLGRFFAAVPRDKRAITLHQLLTHTSGLPSAYRADGITDRDRAVQSILRLRLLSQPGTKYSYSNDGYVLLAAIVEIASGTPFDTFVSDSLFRSARLSHAGLWGHEDSAAAIAPVADARLVRSRRSTIYRNGHSVANWGYRGPTGAYASVRDLHTWIVALRSGRVLGAEAFAKLLGRHVQVRADTTGQNYTGYGWGVRVEDGRDVSYGHAGYEDWLGHTSVIRWTPAGEITVVLANSGEIEGEGWATRINRAIRRLAEAAPLGP